VTTVTTTTGQAQENRDYVRKLLREKLPEFAAMLASAERQLDQDLSRACKRLAGFTPRVGR
jgi:hypothetical protein